MYKVNKRYLLILEILLIIMMVIWIYPLISIFFNSFKSTKEMMTNFMGLPSAYGLEHYSKAWKSLNFSHAFLNTLFVTVLGVLGLTLFGSMAAYKLARSRGKLSKFLFAMMIIPMLVPFQTIMISTTRVASKLHFTGSLVGLAILYWGISMPFTIFLYHGFVKSIPVELDESARIDGASSFRTFWQIIFPLLKSITATNVVIQALFIWNDFLLPLVVISGSKTTRTVQMAIYTSFGSQGVKWETALPSIMMAVIPAIIFFIIMQKYIVRGVSAGAVKG